MLIKSEKEMQKVGEEYGAKLLQQKNFPYVIELLGDVGAGKTTFTRGLAKGLGVEDELSSPSFTISRSYSGKGCILTHFDFYRIENIAEALDIGFYDYVDSGCLCLIEWPENIEDLLPEETLRVSIRVNPDESRTLSWED